MPVDSKFQNPSIDFYFPNTYFTKLGTYIRYGINKQNPIMLEIQMLNLGTESNVGSQHIWALISEFRIWYQMCAHALHTQSPHNVCCIARSAFATWSLTLKILFQTRSGHGLQDYDDFPNGALLGNTRDWPTYPKYSGRIICISVFARSVSKGYVRALPRLPNSGRGHRKTEIVFGNQIPGARPCIQMQVFRTYS